MSNEPDHNSFDSSSSLAFEPSSTIGLEFDEVLKVLECVWTSMASSGSPIPEEWRKERNFLQNLSFVDLLQPMANTSNVVSRASLLATQSKTVSQTLRILANEFEDEYASTTRCLQGLKPMCGLASLPNDVMILIVELIVTPDEKDEHLHSQRSWSALRLSHTSRYFRNLILSFPQLWNQINLHPESSTELTEACIRWSREIPLYIHLTVYMDTPERNEYHNVFSQVLAQAHRWRKLTLHALCYRRTKITSPEMFLRLRNNPPIVIGNSEQAAPPGTSLFAPLLQEIHIEKDKKLPRSSLESLASRFAWDAPRLKILNVTHYFPYDLSPISSVTTLDFTVRRTIFDYPRLLGALRSMRSLEDLRIRFEGVSEELSEDDVTFDAVSLTNVVKFALRFESCCLCMEEQTSARLAFYDALICPNVTKLHLQYHGTAPYRADRFLKLADKQFPSLSDLHLDLWHMNYSPGESAVHLVALSLHYIRRLETLSLQSKVPLYLWDGGVGGRQTLPPIRYLAIYVAHRALRGDSNLRQWIAHYAKQLQGRGDWERFVELTVCTERLRRDRRSIGLVTEERIPRDKVISWCES
ncbi:hypothetical protein SCHPADRAFT_993802 [Schizopora paradoxa]|uniref:Uncharacterized protein n=1 Tax=Schizopora paradoxa TaxID=27342 RepID=A0A0H2S2T8_9AGAM|nr:hypothetical protein SCHPADRAFT_993802 [Schizopora paradoxa]